MIIKILDDLFNTGKSFNARWESLSLEEKIGALAEKTDEIIEKVNELTQEK